MTTRIATLAHHNLTQSFMVATQQRIQELQIQMSSGQKAQRYSGIAPDASRVISMESTNARTDQYLDSNKILGLRLKAMEQNVAGVFDVASSLKTLLVNAINGNNAGELPLNQRAQDMMNEVQRDLNAKIGDRYLFGGTAIDTPPVDFSDPDFTDPPTVYPSNADTSYYQGDSTKLSARIADDYDLDWGVTADEPGFEQVIRALHLTATATTSPPDTDRLQEALNVVNQAIDNLPNIRSRIGASEKEIDTVNTAHHNTQLYLQQAISDIKAVDVPQAVTELADAQTLLQASYMTVARLSGLTLANYLR